MRQLWIAVAILGGMLALTAWNVTVMHQQVQPIVEELHQAAAAAREEDWPRAEALTQTIREQWQEQVPYLQMVHAHEHTDEATLSLQTLEGALASRGSMPPRQPAWRARWRSYSTGNASRRKTCYRDEKTPLPCTGDFIGAGEGIVMGFPDPVGLSRLGSAPAGF